MSETKPDTRMDKIGNMLIFVLAIYVICVGNGISIIGKKFPQETPTEE